jgi:uncharacterized membrane protein YidH (DUF202 family)
MYFGFTVTKGDIRRPAGVYIRFLLSSDGAIWNWKSIIKIQKKKITKTRKLVFVIAVALIIAAFIGNMELNIDSFYTFHNI